MLDVGKKVPKFKLSDETGEEKTFADLTRKKGLVFYVYPKDNTPGCTVESIEFTEHLTAFRRRGYEVVGVSKDSVKSHCNFIEKHSLRVVLLSDPDGKLIEGLGAWGEKKMAGRTYMGILRSTFVVGADGKVLSVYPKVNTNGHAAKVLEDLAAL